MNEKRRDLDSLKPNHNLSSIDVHSSFSFVFTKINFFSQGFCWDRCSTWAAQGQNQETPLLWKKWYSRCKESLFQKCCCSFCFNKTCKRFFWGIFFISAAAVNYLVLSPKNTETFCHLVISLKARKIPHYNFSLKSARNIASNFPCFFMSLFFPRWISFLALVPEAEWVEWVSLRHWEGSDSIFSAGCNLCRQTNAGCCCKTLCFLSNGLLSVLFATFHLFRCVKTLSNSL